MATIFFTCGGDATSEPGTTTHWTASSGVTQSSTHARTGTYALKMSSSATAAYVQKDISAGNRKLITRFSVYVTAYPSTTIRLLEWRDGSWRHIYLSSDGYVYHNAASAQSTNQLPLNQWVTFDFQIDSSADPHLYDWKIGGTTQSQGSVSAAAVDITLLYYGDTSTDSTADWWYDDIAVSLTSGDYPIPAGTTTGTAPEVWTPDSVAPVWTSPANSASMSTTPQLQFNSQVSAVKQHFYLQLDTAATFDTGNLRTYDSSSDQTNWTYWDGDSWEALPSDGLPIASSGNEVRYTVTSALSSSTWYRRVRAGTLV